MSIAAYFAGQEDGVNLFAEGEIVPNETVTITTTSLPAGTAGEAYSVGIEATGTGPITIAASGLPVGLSISASGGVMDGPVPFPFGVIGGSTEYIIAGTPATAGTYSVTLTATNPFGGEDVAVLSLLINAAAGGGDGGGGTVGRWTRITRDDQSWTPTARDEQVWTES